VVFAEPAAVIAAPQVIIEEPAFPVRPISIVEEVIPVPVIREEMPPIRIKEAATAVPAALIIEEPAIVKTENVVVIDPPLVVQKPPIVEHDPLVIESTNVVFEKPPPLIVEQAPIIETPIIHEQSIIIEPILETEVLERIHHLPDPDSMVPVRVSEVKLDNPETYEVPLNIPQVRFIAIEQHVETHEEPIELP